jgi:hypothetical protein
MPSSAGIQYRRNKHKAVEGGQDDTRHGERSRKRDEAEALNGTMGEAGGADKAGGSR